jgi:hypothetical protein
MREFGLELPFNLGEGEKTTKRDLGFEIKLSFIQASKSQHNELHLCKILVLNLFVSFLSS